MAHHSQTYGILMGGANRKAEEEKVGLRFRLPRCVYSDALIASVACERGKSNHSHAGKVVGSPAKYQRIRL